MRWAIFFFLMASLLGLLLRYFFVGGAVLLEYKNVLHAHSHIALLGWGFLLISGTLVFSLVKEKARLKTYKNILTALVIVNLGMLLSFPFQGYGLYSITFSTIHLIIGYVFTYQIFQDLRGIQKGTARYLIRYALIWMLVSSIGLWAIGPIATTLGRLHPLYFLSVQWFLHFQLNGWFMFALLGILALMLERKGWAIPFNGIKLWLLQGSLWLSLALAISWSYNYPILLYINALGVILQAIAYTYILHPFIAAAFPTLTIPSGWINKVLYFGILSVIAKALIQLALIFPEVASISYTIRMFVIGFIHLLLLGSATFALGANALKNNILPNGLWSKWGWLTLIVGFLLSELLLFGQGSLIWAKLGFIPHYHLLLFLSSILFPIGLLMVLTDSLLNKHLPMNERKMKNNVITQISINNQTMKKTIIMSLGALVFLMASCGGGGESSQGTYTPPAAQKEKAADPKGVGEIRTVDLGDGIDEVMANKGKAIVDMKCTACHQLNDKRVVGPGFEGITNKRRPEWIMNMITNVDVMLDEDPVAQALFEECLVRMPNQNISIGDSRDILEFLRKNDFERTGSKDAAVK